jgi:hypothetical protein
MANRKIPNQETLRKLLDYDPETGVFTWKARTADMFAPEAGKRTYRTPQWYADIWNGRLAGKPAGSAYGGGYLGLAIQNEKYLAHRVAWVMHYGEQPTEIDHINGDRSDNRIANLRLVTRTENNMNSARQSNNTSGCQGVTWDKQTNRWRAFIKKDGRTIRLGLRQQGRENAPNANLASMRTAGGRRLDAAWLLVARYARIWTLWTRKGPQRLFRHPRLRTDQGAVTGHC